MIAMRLTLALTLLTACGAPSEPTSTPTATPAAGPTSVGPTTEAVSALSWQLVAEPSALSMDQRADFRLRVVATNPGSVVEHPIEHGMTFAVNGTPSVMLDMAFGNGLSPMTWSDLPPGATESSERGVGESLFVAPGDYEITMVIDGTSHTITVHVSASAPPAASGLAWELVAEPTTLRMARRADFLLRVVATNRGSVVEHPIEHGMTFAVNGEPSMGLDMAFGNGGAPMTWVDLPPGGSETSERAMGDLFTAPGDYEIEASIDGVPHRVTVHVTR